MCSCRLSACRAMDHNDPVDVDARGDNVLGVKFAAGYDAVDLRDGHGCCTRHDRSEVAAGLAEDKLATLVRDVSADEDNVAVDGVFKQIVSAVDGTDLFAVRQRRA